MYENHIWPCFSFPAMQYLQSYLFPKQIRDTSGNMLRADFFFFLGGGGAGVGGLLLLQDTWVIFALYFFSKY